MAKRNFINITELKHIQAECSCGGKMTIYKYGRQYCGECLMCKTKTQPYHSTLAVINEQHKKTLQLQSVT